MSQSRHPAALVPDELVRECEVQRLRRSGPGGQHRNKVETAVVLRHTPTGVDAEANERRSQAENLKEAVRRLRVNLALHVRIELSHDAMPTELWRSRLRGNRIVISPDHADFPALLAEALDVLSHERWDVLAASKRLDCSTSQLVKFLKKEPRALAAVNEHRKQQGLHAMR